MEKVSLKVVVAGRSYPITVSESEKERVLAAAEDINKAIHILKDNYAVKDMQDLLAMSALQMAAKSKNQNQHSASAPADYSEIEKALSDLNDELSALI